jgi:hypothetical protein
MIEFKGTYYKSKTTPSQSVLVQFDGVLLHVWHMSNPFHRILASDVFHVQNTMSRGRRFIKLPNGGRIETDDVKAIVLLRSSNGSLSVKASQFGLLYQRHSLMLIFGAAAALSVFFFTYWLYSS